MSMDARVQTKQWVEKNSGNLLLYFGLIVGIFIFYHAMSDGDFSFLLVSSLDFLCCCSEDEGPLLLRCKNREFNPRF